MPRPAIYGALLIASMSACDQVKNMQGVPALARKGDPQACIHPDTMTLLERVFRREESTEPVPAEEIAALPITITNTSMTAVENGVSVTCSSDIGLPRRMTKGFTYRIIPTADDTDFQITWNSSQNASYVAAKYDWEQEVKNASPIATADQVPFKTSSEGSDQEVVLYQRGGVRLTQSYREGDVLCSGCGGASRRRALNVGNVFFEKAHGDFVLLTQNAGNSVPGGTTYAVDLTTMKISDLQTHSGADPHFEFEDRDGGVVVEVTENGRSRRLQLRPPRPTATPREPVAPANAETTTAAPASPSPSPIEPTLTSPATWIVRPRAMMPERAIDAGVNGSVELRCRATAQGRLTNCQTVRETPSGYGLAAAAATGAAITGRLRPAEADGRAVDSTIQFSVQFRTD